MDTQTVSFNVEFLRESARNIALTHTELSGGEKSRLIKPILQEAKTTLENAYRVLSGYARAEKELTLAAEWLIDNFYIIQEQIVQTESDFPKEFQKTIPLLDQGELKGLPRVYELILNYLTHTDNQTDLQSLIQYIQSYQEVETLRQGEIWAIPIMIRLILIEKLSEKSTRLLQRKEIRKNIEDIVSELGADSDREPGRIVNAISGHFKKNSRPVSVSFYLVELYNQLQASGLLFDEEKRWFNYRFRQTDMQLEEAMRVEAQIESRLQVSVQNAVMSLRESSEIEWSEFVEECSVVEKILRLDPAGVYPDMDFQTRDSYRRAVERISRRSEMAETDVAELVLKLVEESTRGLDQTSIDPLHNRDFLKFHVGYFLIGDGFADLAKRAGYRRPIRDRVKRRLEHSPGLYISAIVAHTIILMGILWWMTGAMALSPGLGTAVLLVSLFPALDLSVSSINRFFAFFLSPRILPKMAFEKEIPDSARTMVVVPTLLSSPEDVTRQIENLEIRSLANPDRSLQFVLLSDFMDADEKEKSGDMAILEAADRAIRDLNLKHSSRFGEKFFLLHRERLWNEREKKWMGWERKRGKLEEFNRLLLEQDAQTCYTHICGQIDEALKSTDVQFIITLDSDTKLPPDSARHLIRTIAHPLNRAWHDPAKGRVTKGYGIIQPRISIPAEVSRRTWFTRIFSGNVGLDPYSTAVSDIYQDLAGEAIFTGKGIYDLKAFHELLDNRFPENRILSHDLIESTYIRSGLATDIELFDDYPSTYSAYSRRSHRWTRGDWQIASWLFGKVPGKNGKEKNPINILSRWKIFDNLRRSLNPLFLTLFFIAGWFFMPGSPWIWTLAAFGILAFPIYISLSSDILNRPARVRWRLYMEKVQDNLKVNSLQALFTVIILPHQAVVQLDAVVRTIYRLGFSRENLLEWTSATQTESISPSSLTAYLLEIIASPIIAAGILIVAIYSAPSTLWIVVPFVFLWAGAPVHLWLISKPYNGDVKGLTDKEREELGIYARKTWSYFERFVNEEHHWLPPDNYQEEPQVPIAGRTSPTNIGLSLVSVQVAANRGYITFSERLERLQRTLRSMDELDRFKGHFYNWYNTSLGEILHPKYISTVDSGNLAASLIVVKQAASVEMEQLDIRKNMWEGLTETVLSVRAIFRELEKDDELPAGSFEQIATICNSLMELLNIPENRSVEWDLGRLKELKKKAALLCSVDLLPMGSKLDDEVMQNLLFWIESPLRLIENRIREYQLFDTQSLDELKKLPMNALFLRVGEEEKGGPLIEQLKIWKRQTDEIVYLCEKFIDDMDFSFLYLKKRGLFSIGYNVEKAMLDEGVYDLLASEARISSYIAIAKGDVPVEHWFRLSRRLTSLNKNEILLSWGGTMFEYLMPELFMRSYRETLLTHTSRYIVEWQKTYGGKRGKPWGLSESAYGFLNIDMHYQYRAFGAPGLGLKRGLAGEYVVSPYASMLALMVDPKESIENLRKLQALGGAGLMGFYDAIDFTPKHLREKEKYRVVKTYMVHHQGMSLIAMENVLNGFAIQELFHSDPRIRGCELILQERIPKGVPIKEPHPIDAELEPGEQKSAVQRVEHAGIDQLDESPPRLHLLGNGSYSMFITHAGSGGGFCNGTMMYRWEPDPTMDQHGVYFYIKDTDSGEFWSSMHQPVKRRPDRYDTWFHNGKVITSRVDNWIETTTQICVSPDHPIELRKLTLTNYSQSPKTVEVTSYAEIVLNGQNDHMSHPAFSKLFVQTDFLNEQHAILAKRRARSSNDKTLWMVHTFAESDKKDGNGPLQYETERSRFIGRGRSLEHPAALDPGARLQSSLGNVSDPIMSLRKTVTLGPGKKTELTFGIGYAESKEDAEKLADVYDNHHAVERAFNLTNIYNSVELDHIGISSSQAHLFQKLASWLLYPGRRFRTGDDVLRENRRTQRDLWAYGISGDLPLIIFRINKTDQLKYVRTLLKAHQFWRMKGLQTEMLFLNDHAPGYIDEIHEAIMAAVESSAQQDRINKKGGIFIQRSDRMTEDDLTLFLTVAHAVFEHRLPDERTLRQNNGQNRSWRPEKTLAVEDTMAKDATNIPPDCFEEAAPKEELKFYNGYGGFSQTGDEYRINIWLDPETGLPVLPPAPWVNVIANPDFGTIITERGSGYTWSENSRENKLTGWSNDPVGDPPSEAIYIRDDLSGRFWSPTPGPVAGRGSYKVSHGFGYTRFNHRSEDLEQTVVHYVADGARDKRTVLSLKNRSDVVRKLSVYRYLEWVLGVDRRNSSRYIIQHASKVTNTLFAQNHYNNEFAGRTAYACVLRSPEASQIEYTTSRAEVIGKNRTTRNPLIVDSGVSTANTIVTGEDPCALFRIQFELQPGEEAEIVCLEGESDSQTKAAGHIESLREYYSFEKDLKQLRERWRKRLGQLTVRTPDTSINVMLNGWLMYQNLSCRMWGRTGFYQSGGAFGYRDQLQDAMAACYSDPDITRKQILLHASHQFMEGDVLHWWHPPTGRGIRSKITDDRLWLPYVTDFYIRSTGDKNILDEMELYVTARELEDHEHEVYLQPRKSDVKESLYRHCCKAIDVSLKFGSHGLPLIGAGDWNDGMNRVGEKGKGESVWLGFFLYDILNRFETICRMRGDSEKADDYKAHATSLRNHLNNDGWDGKWYLRAFYDDGTPLGASSNTECRIDAISQAWSVLSGAADAEKGRVALKSADRILVSGEHQLIRLLYPPFDRTEKDPGYIKGYIPGVRENGGQYTHGALWLVRAFAESGQGNKAVQYFNMINPINHALHKEAADRYKVEPYVATADVYGEPPLSGTGGWSWYTGSGGWMYRVALESILGFRMNASGFEIDPSISDNWPRFEIRFRPDENGTEYLVRVKNPEGLESGYLSGSIDGKLIEKATRPLKVSVLNDGKKHTVELTLHRKKTRKVNAVM